MKCLFFASRTFNVSILLDEATSLAKAKNEVFFIYNSCATGICHTNLSQYSVECEICKRRWKKAMDLLPKSVKKINLTEYWDAAKSYPYEFNTVQDIKNIKYKDVKVGYAVMSSFFSVTRNLNPLIDNESRRLFSKMIDCSCRITDALETAINDICPDRMYFWNSRFYDVRPAFDLAKANGIDAISMERTTAVNKRNSKRRFVNHTPHDIIYRDNLHKQIWAEAPFSYEEKYMLGESFFLKRRNGIAAGDKVYVKNQQAGVLPDDWDINKKNVVIFNSSEDEFAAIGEDYDKLALFPTQYRGIKYILESLKDQKSYHVYLRIHPNLAKIKYRYHTELLKLQDKYENLTVIPAADSISTYALMDAAEKVVVFGSTMGLESAYWGKPVILLSGAIYYNSELCYVPHTTKELDVLLTQALAPKNMKEEAIKWGFYMLYRNPVDYAKFVDIDSHWFSIGRHRWLDVHYLKLLGSSKLYAIYTDLLVRYYKRHATSNPLPLTEDINAEL